MSACSFADAHSEFSYTKPLVAYRGRWGEGIEFGDGAKSRGVPPP
jgi:hypothetical protein